METIKGRVSKLSRDVEVGGDSDSVTLDITRFEIAGRLMQFKSSRPTYDMLSEGDELVVAGKATSIVFQVTAYRNLTKNIRSYKGQGSALMRVMASVILLLGLGCAALLFFLRVALIPLLTVSASLLISGLILLYVDKKYRDAIKLIESYK